MLHGLKEDGRLETLVKETTDPTVNPLINVSGKGKDQSLDLAKTRNPDFFKHLGRVYPVPLIFVER